MSPTAPSLQDLRLYGYWRSSCSWRVRIALHHKGLAFAQTAVNLLEGKQFEPAHGERSPLFQVPVLEWSSGGRVSRLAQSMAILELLEELFPSPPLLPREPLDRARVRALAEHINSGIQPLQNASVQKHLKGISPEANDAFLRRFVDPNMARLEAAIRQTAGRYAYGDEVTFVDALLVPQLYAARRFGVDVSGFSTLLRIEEACQALPAFQAAHADRQPDAVSQNPAPSAPAPTR